MNDDVQRVRQEIHILERQRIEAARVLGKLDRICNDLEAAVAAIETVDTDPEHREELLGSLSNSRRLVADELRSTREWLSDVELDLKWAHDRLDHARRKRLGP
ncbi:MAG TPA: hypothetical protein VE288_18500 [Rubrobacteraceae bacterium]|jgi:predicted  nucleic acid-binding Zn-ribbon protein|nr:hypothetical protein [Rubrobacteraceae bacterium]